MAETETESEAPYTVRDSDLLRVLVALAGRIVCPPERLIQVLGPYSEAYNLCTGNLTLAAIARSTGVDKSNLRKAMRRWEQAGVLFRVGPHGRPLHLYSLPTQNERARSRSREGIKTLPSAEPFNGEVDG